VLSSPLNFIELRTSCGSCNLPPSINVNYVKGEMLDCPAPRENNCSHRLTASSLLPSISSLAEAFTRDEQSVGQIRPDDRQGIRAARTTRRSGLSTLCRPGPAIPCCRSGCFLLPIAITQPDFCPLLELRLPDVLAALLADSVVLCVAALLQRSKKHIDGQRICFRW
jgi:hypothetical protein